MDGVTLLRFNVGEYDNVFRIGMCIPVAVDVWTICYIILIGLKVIGWRPIVFGRNRLGTVNVITIVMYM